MFGEQSREDEDRACEEDAEGHACTPRRLACEAIPFGGPAPLVESSVFVEVGAKRLSEVICVRGFEEGHGITGDYGTIEGGKRFAEDDRDHHEGDEEEEVHEGDDEKANVCLSPKERDGDEAVETGQ